jgi:hypothetical protein
MRKTGAPAVDCDSLLFGISVPIRFAEATTGLRDMFEFF